MDPRTGEIFCFAVWMNGKPQPLTDQKGNILQGERGYSQKGEQSGNASLYYSQPRLESRGTLRIAGVSYQVTGLKR